MGRSMKRLIRAIARIANRTMNRIAAALLAAMDWVMPHLIYYGIISMALAVLITGVVVFLNHILNGG